MLPTAILGKLRETGIPQTIGGFSMQVYADNAATTKMSQTSIDAMLPYMTTVYGNITRTNFILLSLANLILPL